MIRIHRFGLIALVIVATLFGALARPAVADDVEARIAAFWAKVNAMQPTDYLLASDIGGWALNVVERQPRTRMTVADFRDATGAMQAAMDRAGLAPIGAVPSPTPVPAALAVTSATSSFNVFGWYEVVGEVRNTGSTLARYVQVVATFYDASGAVIDTSSSYTNPSDISPASAAPFKVWSTKGSSVARYKLVVTTS